MTTNMIKVTTLAADHRYRKLNKRDMRAKLRDLIKEDRKPDLADWVDIYTYFVDRKPSRIVKKPTDWLIKHRASQDVRPNLNQVYSDSTTLFATNGHVLAAMPTALAEGYYDDDLCQIELDHKYVNANDVILKDNLIKTETTPAEVLASEIHTSNTNRQLIKIDNRYYQHEYIKDALSLAKADESIFLAVSSDASQSGRNKQLQISFADYPKHIAVVMPFVGAVEGQD